METTRRPGRHSNNKSMGEMLLLVRNATNRQTVDTEYRYFVLSSLLVHAVDSRLNNAFKLCNFISKIIAVVPDFHKRILFSDEAHFWLNGYVNKQNCRIWSEANPQVYVETPLHTEKLTVWCALWAGGILLQKR
ncbi:DUF4817 domain-containing protein [Trichonephila clavipes]|nr:DUF4817 domain-containing protein [Trichonephila clavipes]